jgi:hypothetical protein
VFVLALALLSGSVEAQTSAWGREGCQSNVCGPVGASCFFWPHGNQGCENTTEMESSQVTFDLLSLLRVRLRFQC